MPHSLFNEVPEDKLKHIIDAQQLHTAYRAAFQKQSAIRGGSIGKARTVRSTSSAPDMTTGYASGKPRTQKRSHRRNPPLSHGTISGVSQAARGPYRETRETGQDQSCVAPGQCAAPGHQGVGPDRKRRAGQENHDHRHECDVRLRLRGQCHVCRLHHGDARSDLLWDSRSKLRIASGPKGLARRHSAWRPILHENRGQAIHASEQRGLPGRLDQARRGYQHSEPGQIWANEEDFWAVKVHNMDWLLSAPRFEQIVISTNGGMATMTTVDPRAFGLFKVWLSEQNARCRQTQTGFRSGDCHLSTDRRMASTTFFRRHQDDTGTNPGPRARHLSLKPT